MTDDRRPETEPLWLTSDERAAWVALAGMVVRLPKALDAQLERDAGLSFYEYMVMAMLSDQPDRTLRMSQLAGVTSSSASSATSAPLFSRGLTAKAARVHRQPDVHSVRE